MNASVRRIAVGASLLCSSLGGVAVVAAAPAGATPTSCAVAAYGSYGYKGICRSGSGTYEVVAKCEDPLRGSISYFYGNTVGIGHYSYVTCPREGGVQFLPEGAAIQQVS